MDEALGQRSSTVPPVLTASIPEDTPGPSGTAPEREEEEEDDDDGDDEEGSQPRRKRKREDELLNLIREDMELQREAEGKERAENV